MSDDDRKDLRALFDRWIVDLRAKHAHGDEKAVLRGLDKLYRPLEEFAESHPEERDVVLPILIERWEEGIEGLYAWREHRSQ
jgi:hypothetical protein